MKPTCSGIGKNVIAHIAVISLDIFVRHPLVHRMAAKVMMEKSPTPGPSDCLLPSVDTSVHKVRSTVYNAVHCRRGC